MILARVSELDLHREAVDRALAAAGLGWDAWPDAATSGASLSEPGKPADPAPSDIGMGGACIPRLIHTDIGVRGGA